MTSFLIRLYSEEYEEETFWYQNIQEAKQGFKRLQRTCSDQYEQDRIYRTLTLLTVHDEWNTNDMG